jgi:DNA-binding FadR family transcriptional regulator
MMYGVSQPTIAVALHALGELRFLARERTANRRGTSTEAFAAADHAFHRAIAGLVAGAEGAPTLVDWVGRRLRSTLIAAAEAHAADEQLDAAHLATADAIAEGNWVRAGRRARFVARREARAITASLG